MSSCDISAANNVYVTLSSILVFSMIPGLAFFELGLLPKRLSSIIVMQVLVGFAVAWLFWVVAGFSLVFGEHAYSHILFWGVRADSCLHVFDRDLSGALYAIFYGLFAAIMPLLVTGAYAGRVAVLQSVALSAGLSALVFVPVAGQIWGGGRLQQWGVFDFAGGIVIHVTAGVASLVCAAVVGPSPAEGDDEPASLPFAALGAGLLMVSVLYPLSYMCVAY